MRFYLVDRILEFKEKKSLLAVKNVSKVEEFFENQNPNTQVMPPMLVLEANLQAAAWLITASTNFTKRAILFALGEVSFYHEVFPGDQLIIEIEIQSWMEEGVLVRAKTEVNNKIVIEWNGICVLIEAKQLEEPEKTRHMFDLLVRKF